ncbi:MAG: hypothetical protein AAF298_04285 [Cyanobacteria bacterium P01_A01_bin.40]
MSLPSKKRGFRRVIVNFTEYNWSYFSQDEKVSLDVRLSAKPRHKLTVNLNSKDPWLQMRANIRFHHLHPCSAPITPKFVVHAIKKSLELGWQPEVFSQFVIQYQNGIFSKEKYDE